MKKQNDGIMTAQLAPDIAQFFIAQFFVPYKFVSQAHLRNYPLDPQTHWESTDFIHELPTLRRSAFCSDRQSEKLYHP